MWEENAEERLSSIGHDEIKLLDGYDPALIGIDMEGRAVYDYDLMVEWLMKYDCEGFDEAVSWLEENTIAALPYMGEGHPIVVQHLPDMEISCRKV